MRRSRPQSNIKDVAPNGFFINMRTDYRRLDAEAGSDELRDVKRGEPVIVFDDELGGTWRDNHTHAITIMPTGMEMVGWRCLGIASTHCNYDSDLNADRGFVCQVGGVVTCQNDSKRDIRTGDLIFVRPRGPDDDPIRERGIPKNKQRFVLEPRGWRENNLEHAVGTAMSSAKPGYKFDLKLHKV